MSFTHNDIIKNILIVFSNELFLIEGEHAYEE